jgi:enoyl-CoA hydratase/carnithine racemase
MEFDNILYSKHDHIARITLNQPETLNSVTGPMCQDFLAALDDIEADEDVRVFILTGAGRGFCSGANVGTLSAGVSTNHAGSGILGSTLVRRIDAMKIPTIAMVNGVAAGGGAALAFVCDMRVGAPAARFINAFQRIGLGSGWGGPKLYARAMGVPKAMEIMLTGDALESEEAYRVGALNQLVPAESLESETMNLAARLANAAPLAVRDTKQQILEGLTTDLETATDRSDHGERVTIPSEDHKEGVAAFMEKRKAVFKGR